MNALSVMTDIEFLSLSEVPQDVLYLYKPHSGLLRRAVKARVEEAAARAGRTLAALSINSLTAIVRGGKTGESQEPETKVIEFLSLKTSLTMPSLVGTHLIICDLGNQDLKKLPLHDIEQALYAVAGGGTNQRLCLLVPEDHEVLARRGWQAAVGKVGLIVEPMVAVENYRVVARSYFSQSRLGDLSHLSSDQRFMRRLKELVKNGCTPVEFSKQIDVIVLTETVNGRFVQVVEKKELRKERAVLPETLRKFLDSRDAQSFSALMVLIDRLRHEHLLQPTDVLRRLYDATKRTLESRDKRYRDPSSLAHVIWGILLLTWEPAFLKGNVFVAMDQLGQEYARAATEPNWFAVTGEWQTIARLTDIGVVRDPGRLDNARSGLQNTLSKRIHALNEPALSWFQPIANPVERGYNADTVREQLPETVTKVE